MIFAEPLTGLEKITFYAAPATNSPTPYTIPDKLQLVELITGGVVYFDDGSGRRAYRRGTIFWHIAGEKTICETTREEPYRCMVFRFFADENRRIAPRVSHWLGSEESLEEFIQQCYSIFCMAQTAAAPLPPLEVLGNYSAAKLLMSALKLERFHAQSVATEIISGDEKSFRTLLAYIDKNLAGDLSAATLTAAAKLPRNKLFVLFKKFLQTTPHEYIMLKRMELARRKLGETNLPLKEIAGSCGFERIEVFHRVFAKYVGSTPKHYREEQRKFVNFSQ